MAHHAYKIRFFFSDHLLKIVVLVISHYFFRSALSLPATGKDCLEKRTLSISLNSLCYDMFGSS